MPLWTPSGGAAGIIHHDLDTGKKTLRPEMASNQTRDAAAESSRRGKKVKVSGDILGH